MDRRVSVESVNGGIHGVAEVEHPDLVRLQLLIDAQYDFVQASLVRWNRARRTAASSEAQQQNRQESRDSLSFKHRQILICECTGRSVFVTEGGRLIF